MEKAGRLQEFCRSEGLVSTLVHVLHSLWGVGEVPVWVLWPSGSFSVFSDTGQREQAGSTEHYCVQLASPPGALWLGRPMPGCCRPRSAPSSLRTPLSTQPRELASPSGQFLRLGETALLSVI